MLKTEGRETLASMLIGAYILKRKGDPRLKEWEKRKDKRYGYSN